MFMIHVGTHLLLLRCSCFFVIAVKLKAKDYNRTTSIFFLSTSCKSTSTTNMHFSDIFHLWISVATALRPHNFMHRLCCFHWLYKTDVAYKDIMFDENRSTGSKVQAGKHTYRLLCSLKILFLLRMQMC